MSRHAAIALAGAAFLAALAFWLWRAPEGVLVEVETEPTVHEPPEIPPDFMLRHRLPVFNGRWAYRSSVKKAA